MPDTKIVYYTADKVYRPEEIAEVFAQFGPKDPIMLVLRQILLERQARASVDASSPNLTERGAGHAGGRIQEIIDLHTEILNYLPERDEVQPLKTRRRQSTPRE